MVVVYFLWLYFVCSYCVAPGKNFKAKALEQLLIDKFSIRIHISFASIPRIAPIGGTTIEVKSTLQLQEWLCVNENKCID